MKKPTPPEPPHLAFYGNVVIPRCPCPSCGQTSFVLDGKSACCDEPIGELPSLCLRLTEARFRRRQPKAADKRAILLIQEERCLYCCLLFGDFIVNRRARVIQLKLCWDHFVPYCYNANNYPHNFVAACQICNSIKSDLMFDTIEEAREYVATKRKKKGYTP